MLWFSDAAGAESILDINAGVKISFLYFELDGKKKQVLKNDGKPYTVVLLILSGMVIIIT